MSSERILSNDEIADILDGFGLPAPIGGCYGRVIPNTITECEYSLLVFKKPESSLKVSMTIVPSPHAVHVHRMQEKHRGACGETHRISYTSHFDGTETCMTNSGGTVILSEIYTDVAVKTMRDYIMA